MSLREVVHAAVGKWGVVAMQLVIIVNNLGGLVVFLIIIGDVLAGQQGEPGLATSLGCASMALSSSSRASTSDPPLSPSTPRQVTVEQPPGGSGGDGVDGSHAAVHAAQGGLVEVHKRAVYVPLLPVHQHHHRAGD
jgi:hypothetical protein